MFLAYAMCVRSTQHQDIVGISLRVTHIARLVQESIKDWFRENIHVVADCLSELWYDLLLIYNVETV